MQAEFIIEPFSYIQNVSVTICYNIVFGQLGELALRLLE
jgi:hypothetical protein